MSDSQCYLCGKPGKFEKLFRGCKHESACHSCLRNCYVIQAQNVTQYPLQCFHPECNLVLRSTQIERFVQSEQELEKYHSLSMRAKTHKVQLGDNWQEILEALGEALAINEICKCPGCNMLVTKNGGCDHMSCICGTEFNWCYYRQEVEGIQYKHYLTAHRHSVEASALHDQTKRVPQINDDFLENSTDYLSVIDGSVEVFAEDATEDVPNDAYEAVETNAGEDPTHSTAPTMNARLSDTESFPPLKAQASSNSAETQTSWEQDFHVLELSSESSDDSWTQFDPEAETDENDFQTVSSSQSTSWEEVSEVSSVISFHSKTGMSFLDAARAKASSNQTLVTQNNRWKEVTKAPKPTIRVRATIAEENRKPTVNKPESSDEMFDADFMFNGAKSSRGGKQKYMFKHQPKRKYHRRDRLRQR